MSVIHPVVKYVVTQLVQMFFAEDFAPTFFSMVPAAHPASQSMLTVLSSWGRNSAQFADCLVTGNLSVVPRVYTQFSKSNSVLIFWAEAVQHSCPQLAKMLLQPAICKFAIL